MLRSSEEQSNAFVHACIYFAQYLLPSFNYILDNLAFSTLWSILVIGVKLHAKPILVIIICMMKTILVSLYRVGDKFQTDISVR